MSDSQAAKGDDTLNPTDERGQDISAQSSTLSVSAMEKSKSDQQSEGMEVEKQEAASTENSENNGQENEEEEKEDPEQARYKGLLKTDHFILSKEKPMIPDYIFMSFLKHIKVVK